MCNNVKKVSSGEVSSEAEGKRVKTSGKAQGHDYSCSVNARQVGGLVALVAAVLLLTLAAVFASGVFGGGKMFFLSAGVTVVSMIGFAAAAYFLIPQSSPIKTLGSIEDARKTS